MTPPSSWLVDNAALVPRGGRVLDVACGRGRNAIWLAQNGFEVVAIDRNVEAIEALCEVANRMMLQVDARVVDLETDPAPDLGSEIYDGIVVFNYLHRSLFPVLQAALKPAGVLVYETFTTGQAERGHPRNPDFLLQDGELQRLVSPLEILRSRQGDVDGQLIASVVACKRL